MKRNFAREYQNIEFVQKSEKKKIGVLAMGQGAGGTFLSLALAQELAEQERAVAFVEVGSGFEGKPLTYHAMDMGQRFSKRGYKNIYGEIENGRRIREKKNIEAGINWALISPEENLRNIALTSLQETVLINGVSGDYIVCDLGSCYNADRVSQMDLILCVVDPLPAKLIGNHHIYRRLIQGDIPVIWVINKDNPGIHRKSLYAYMKLRKAVTVPLLPLDLLYKAEYQCRLPYEQREIKKILKPIMEKITKNHILIT